MDLKKYASKIKIVDITSDDLTGALEEMLSVVPDSVFKNGTKKKEILKTLIDREKSLTTYLGNGILMPHGKAVMSQRYVFVIGRCKNGINFNNSDIYGKTRLIFMLLANEKSKDYLQVLSQLARVFLQDDAVSFALASSDFLTFKDRVSELFTPQKRDEKDKDSVFNDARRFLMQAKRIAKMSNSTAVVLFGDTFSQGINLENIFEDLKLMIVTEHPQESFGGKDISFLNVKAFSESRLSQVSSAVLLGLTRGYFNLKDKICCVGGRINSNCIDTIAVLDIATEFSNFFGFEKEILPAGVKPEVLERILAIATELAVEGREGKPVGCMFIIGDSKKIQPFTKQLVLNPFFGYVAEDRNVLSPFMDETIKEYSMLDGAIVVDGSGILDSAGTLIHVPDFKLNVPGGYGSRHAAAYSISLVIDCFAVAVSSSSGVITLFRNGKMIQLNQKSRA